MWLRESEKEKEKAREGKRKAEKEKGRERGGEKEMETERELLNTIPFHWGFFGKDIDYLWGRLLKIDSILSTVSFILDIMDEDILFALSNKVQLWTALFVIIYW